MMQTNHRALARVIAMLMLVAALLPAAFGQSEDVSDYGDEDSYSTEANRAPKVLTNQALASNGATVVASSTNPFGQYPPADAIDGERGGVRWASGFGGWRDTTEAAFPDWLEVSFPSEKKIREVHLFSVQDDYGNPSDPNLDMTFVHYGLLDYEVQYWNGTSWVLAASVVGNNLVWSRAAFPEVATTKIRIMVKRAGAGRSRIVEVEAWGTDALQSLPQPAGTPNPGGCNAGGAGPCEMIHNIFKAMSTPTTQPLPYPNIQSRNYNWDFSFWRGAGGDGMKYDSQNMPALIFSLALWRPDMRRGHPLEDVLKWWEDFLDCQNGNQCRPAVPDSLARLKGAELFSGTYDADVMIAVLAVRHWAIREVMAGRNPVRMKELAVKAQTYLRYSWMAYTLAAGTDRANTVTSRTTPASPQPCQHPSDAEPPFLALAGMRSAPSSLCGDNQDADHRAIVFARAIRWNGRRAFNRTPTSYEEILGFLERQDQGNIFPEVDAYGLNQAHRDLATDHIMHGTRASELAAYLANVRTHVRYHFIGLERNGSQIRVTVMESNINRNTVPIYAVIYHGGTKSARVLYPWSELAGLRCGCEKEDAAQRPNFCRAEQVNWRPFRAQISLPGYAGLFRNGVKIDDGTLPEFIVASNQPPGATTGTCVHEFGKPLIDSVRFPPGRIKYHLVLGPTGLEQF